MNYSSKSTEGFNGADVEAFCDKLKMLAINNSIETGTDIPITMDDVIQVEKTIHSGVSDEDIKRLTEFNNSD